MKILKIEDIVVGRKYKMKTKGECICLRDVLNIKDTGLCGGMPHGQIVTISNKGKIIVEIEECPWNLNYSPQWFEEIKKNNMKLV